MSLKNVSIRIEEEMLQKLNCIANYEGRSLNSQIFILIRNSIETFENDNGNIKDSINLSFNAKPRKQKKS